MNQIDKRREQIKAELSTVIQDALFEYQKEHGVNYSGVNVRFPNEVRSSEPNRVVEMIVSVEFRI